MPASIFTSNNRAQAFFFLLALLSAPRAGFAAASEPPGPGGPGNSGKTFQPEEDDFSSTPFTEYGEFNDEKDEEEEAKFLAHGRFFGVSAGLGYEGVTGNRGLLWQGGFPMVDLKLHYWFDFNFALDLGGYFASHSYQTTPALGTQVSVNMVHLGVDGKYYLDTKNLSAPISFANPYFMVGFGSFTKTEASSTLNTNQSDTGVGLSAGAGLEFALKPGKSYLELEGRYHIVTFKDTHTALFADQHIDDLTGGFFTFNANILFVW
jgi:hypothetical protein